jgi:UDP-N-acetylglucosamine--N-acetylmuramyl-(pentapeptide) pyrophosphoryl-undecaprenol N-acetylglucosamine transferase
MTFIIAAAGTGGHVFPGLSVGEALIDLGVPRDEILFVGGDRLAAKVYPGEGFSFLQVELRGLQRSLTPKNLILPHVVRKAKNRIHRAIVEELVLVVLGMGGYVTIPTGMAARKAKIPFLVSEQNAEAGLANRIATRWALRTFGSFPQTSGLPDAEWVGNPVRKPFWSFDRDALTAGAQRRYGIEPGVPVLGIFGGSLGAGAINEAVSTMLADWDGPRLAVVHLTGARNFEAHQPLRHAPSVQWVRVAFEESMETFYAISDLVVSRAGGAVAELTVTGTPSILVPGVFGSAGHQIGNARYLTKSGAAVTLSESEIGLLSDVVKSILFNDDSLEVMRDSALEIAKPDAAATIAGAMIEAAR